MRITLSEHYDTCLSIICYNFIKKIGRLLSTVHRIKLKKATFVTSVDDWYNHRFLIFYIIPRIPFGYAKLLQIKLILIFYRLLKQILMFIN